MASDDYDMFYAMGDATPTRAPRAPKPHDSRHSSLSAHEDLEAKTGTNATAIDLSLGPLAAHHRYGQHALIQGSQSGDPHINAATSSVQKTPQRTLNVSNTNGDDVFALDEEFMQGFTDGVETPKARRAAPNERDREPRGVNASMAPAPTAIPAAQTAIRSTKATEPGHDAQPLFKPVRVSAPFWCQSQYVNTFNAAAPPANIELAYPSALISLMSVNPAAFQMPHGSRVISIVAQHLANVIMAIREGQWILEKSVADHVVRFWSEHKHSTRRVFLLISVNGSKYFCGLVEMTGAGHPADSIGAWQAHTKDGFISIPIKWVFIKSVPFHMLFQECQGSFVPSITNQWNEMVLSEPYGRKVVKSFVQAPHIENVLCWPAHLRNPLECGREHPLRSDFKTYIDSGASTKIKGPQFKSDDNDEASLYSDRKDDTSSQLPQEPGTRIDLASARSDDTGSRASANQSAKRSTTHPPPSSSWSLMLPNNAAPQGTMHGVFPHDGTSVGAAGQATNMHYGPHPDGLFREFELLSTMSVTEQNLYRRQTNPGYHTMLDHYYAQRPSHDALTATQGLGPYDVGYCPQESAPRDFRPPYASTIQHHQGSNILPQPSGHNEFGYPVYDNHLYGQAAVTGNVPRQHVFRQHAFNQHRHDGQAYAQQYQPQAYAYQQGHYQQPYPNQRGQHQQAYAGPQHLTYARLHGQHQQTYAHQNGQYAGAWSPRLRSASSEPPCPPPAPPNSPTTDGGQVGGAAGGARRFLEAARRLAARLGGVAPAGHD